MSRSKVFILLLILGQLGFILLWTNLPNTQPNQSTIKVKPNPSQQDISNTNLKPLKPDPILQAQIKQLQQERSQLAKQLKDQGPTQTIQTLYSTPESKSVLQYANINPKDISPEVLHALQLNLEVHHPWANARLQASLAPEQFNKLQETLTYIHENSAITDMENALAMDIEPLSPEQRYRLMQNFIAEKTNIVYNASNINSMEEFYEELAYQQEQTLQNAKSYLSENQFQHISMYLQTKFELEYLQERANIDLQHVDLQHVIQPWRAIKKQLSFYFG